MRRGRLSQVGGLGMFHLQGSDRHVGVCLLLRSPALSAGVVCPGESRLVIPSYSHVQSVVVGGTVMVTRASLVKWNLLSL